MPWSRGLHPRQSGLSCHNFKFVGRIALAEAACDDALGACEGSRKHACRSCFTTQRLDLVFSLPPLLLTSSTTLAMAKANSFRLYAMGAAIVLAFALMVQVLESVKVTDNDQKGR